MLMTPLPTVEALHRALGGDPLTEAAILRFIADRYQARTLAHLPPRVAEQALSRPKDFLRAAKQHAAPAPAF
jgi:hypothetical protein